MSRKIYEVNDHQHEVKGDVISPRYGKMFKIKLIINSYYAYIKKVAPMGLDLSAAFSNYKQDAPKVLNRILYLS